MELISTKTNKFIYTEESQTSICNVESEDNKQQMVFKVIEYFNYEVDEIIQKQI